MAEFFKFEADFVDSLRCIPMQVRYKLDTCGVKLKLNHWHQFTAAERQQLVELPCDPGTAAQTYRDRIQQMVVQQTGAPAKDLDIDPNPAWHNDDVVPAQVQEKAAEFSITLTPDQWRTLTPLQRFALIKLSRPSHENKNFLPALKEFHLV
jgi:hypothetical protein